MTCLADAVPCFAPEADEAIVAGMCGCLLADGEAAETACAGPSVSGAEALAQRGEVAPDSGIVEVFIAEIRMRGWCCGQSGDKENGFDYWVSESGSFTYFAIRWRRLHEGPEE